MDYESIKKMAVENHIKNKELESLERTVELDPGPNSTADMIILSPIIDADGDLENACIVVRDLNSAVELYEKECVILRDELLRLFPLEADNGK